MAQTAEVQTCGLLPYSNCHNTYDSAGNYSGNFWLSPCCVSGASLETRRLVNLQNTDVKAKLDSVTDDTLTLLPETF